MDFEAPADAWYVWVGVALTSAAAAGVVLGLPTTAPPDAAAAANAVDRVAGSAYPASGSYDHNARSYWVAGERLAMRNAGGTARATLSYGPVVPADEDRRLELLLQGVDPGQVFGTDRQGFLAFRAAVDRARDAASTEWETANGTLRVRTIHWRDTRVVLVDA